MSNYSLDVLVNGRPVKQYHKDGRQFIEGRSGTSYSIRVRNNNFNRVLAIVSVDGLDVIGGKPASDKSAGYVIEPWKALEVKGFRETNLTVGAFTFTNRDSSYAAGEGQPANVGVIGVRLFEEKIEAQVSNDPTSWIYTTGVFSGYLAPPPEKLKNGFGGLTEDHTSLQNSLSDPNVDIRSFPGQKRGLYNAQITSSVKAPEPVANSFDLGTNWGARVTDRVVTTNFERGAVSAQLEIFYASRASLESLGIRFVEETPISFPQSFPNYCQPPKGWNNTIHNT